MTSTHYGPFGSREGNVRDLGVGDDTRDTPGAT